jgi:hypothetical protein
MKDIEKLKRVISELKSKSIEVKDVFGSLFSDTHSTTVGEEFKELFKEIENEIGFNFIIDKDLKEGTFVRTSANHILKLKEINHDWTKRLNNGIVYWNFDIVKESDSGYMGEVISLNNIAEILPVVKFKTRYRITGSNDIIDCDDNLSIDQLIIINDKVCIITGIEYTSWKRNSYKIREL